MRLVERKIHTPSIVNNYRCERDSNKIFSVKVEDIIREALLKAGSNPINYVKLNNQPLKILDDDDLISIPTIRHKFKNLRIELGIPEKEISIERRKFLIDLDNKLNKLNRPITCKDVNFSEQ